MIAFFFSLIVMSCCRLFSDRTNSSMKRRMNSFELFGKAESRLSTFLLFVVVVVMMSDGGDFGDVIPYFPFNSHSSDLVWYPVSSLHLVLYSSCPVQLKIVDLVQQQQKGETERMGRVILSGLFKRKSTPVERRMWSTLWPKSRYGTVTTTKNNNKSKQQPRAKLFRFCPKVVGKSRGGNKKKKRHLDDGGKAKEVRLIGQARQFLVRRKKLPCHACTRVDPLVVQSKSILMIW